MKKFLLIFSFVIIHVSLFAQQSEVPDVLERIVEEIVANSDEGVDVSELIDNLQVLIENPINVNTAGIGDLEQLPFLTDNQIENLLNAVARYGNMLSIYEVLYVPGFSKKDVMNLQPFVYFEKTERKFKFKPRDLLYRGRNRLYLRYQRVLERQKGYTDIFAEDLAESPNSRYHGDANRLYMRYQYQLGKKVLAGFTAEKDPGEQFFAGEQRSGFDFNTAFVQLNDVWKFNKIIVGDFQAQYGQGLAIWSGYGVDKSSYVLNVRKKEGALKKFSSTDENRYMRGVAATAEFGRFRVSAFASHKNVDANVEETELDEEAPAISSLQLTGLHRTDSEMEKRKAIGESTFGTNVKYFGKQLSVGLTALHYQFSLPLNPDDALYYLYKESGTENSNVSLDYYWRLHGHRFFGEAAVSANGGLAVLNGANFQVNKNISLAVLHRYYDKKYQAYYGNSFRENTTVQNENGLYFGVEVFPAPKWRVGAYADTYQFPWLKFSAVAPSKGTEYFTEVEYLPSYGVSMYARFKFENKEENQSGVDSGLKGITERSRWAARYHISYRISRRLTLKNRIEISRYEKEGAKEDGYMLFQDVNYDFETLPLQLRFRFAMFETTYNARIYAYESDVLYAFSVPAYSGHGYRTFLMLNYDVNERITGWLRFGGFYYSDRETIGSGLDEIEGQFKSEVKAQFRFKF